MRSFTFLPSFSLRVHAAQDHKFKEKFAYPKLFRSLNFERRRNEEILATLQDLKYRQPAKKRANNEVDAV